MVKGKIGEIYMKEIFEQYGFGLIEFVSGTLMLGIVGAVFFEREILLCLTQFLKGIAG